MSLFARNVNTKGWFCTNVWNILPGLWGVIACKGEGLRPAAFEALKENPLDKLIDVRFSKNETSYNALGRR